MTDDIWLIILIVIVPAAFLGGFECGLHAFNPIQIVLHEAKNDRT